MNDIN